MEVHDSLERLAIVLAERAHNRFNIARVIFQLVIQVALNCPREAQVGTLEVESVFAR